MPCTVADAVLVSTHMNTVRADIGIQPIIATGVIRTDGWTILGADDKSDGARFEPDGGYQLRVNADGLPSLNAFWFLAAYTAADPHLIPNPANRYSVGDTIQT